MPAPAPAPNPPAAPGERLTHPQAANDLLMYRLNRLLAVAGSLVVRLCEGGYGITRREWGLLLMLSHHPGMPPAELAQRLGLDRARTSRAITSLLAKKLITRDAMPGDRRQAVLSLTSAGQALHGDLFPQVKALNQDLLAGLDAEAVRTLDQALADMQRRAEALVTTRTDVPRTYRLRGGRHMDAGA
ncbi:MarR family winged helix-turn-helix transcriptional regulator [Acidovorax sp.]|uniref:MarR family winged helix-turn-helix transcriptional regulator n=1 Tax=Acidovorax sp. TaxID=1872122 RepID=UPI00391CFCEF